MVVAAGGEMAGAEDLLILDVRAGDRQDLGAETEFAEDAGHRIVLQIGVVRVDGAGLPWIRVELMMRRSTTSRTPRVPSSYFIGNWPSGIRRDEIDFAGREVGDVGSEP